MHNIISAKSLASSVEFSLLVIISYCIPKSLSASWTRKGSSVRYICIWRIFTYITPAAFSMLFQASTFILIESYCVLLPFSTKPDGISLL